jgi:hypothetical protein
VIACLVYGWTFASVIVASPASAALCARWNPPEQTSVGNSVSISFRTYAPVSTGANSYSLEPRPFPKYRFRVMALSPGGTEVPVAMVPSDEGSLQWLGEFIPDRAGSWTLHIANLSDAEAACYEDVSLEVTEGPHGLEWTYLLIGFGAICAIGAGVVVLGRRTRPESSGPTSLRPRSDHHYSRSNEQDRSQGPDD